MNVMTWAQANAAGVVHYYTGKPCKYGHISERKTASGNCIECLKTVHYAAAQDEKRRFGKRHGLRKRAKERTGENAAKYTARRMVYDAVRTGKMAKKPCERCGTTHRIHAHHDDYSRPLEVVWLCPLHHAERHKELKEQGWRG